MKIRAKIFLVVLPVIVVTLTVAAATSYFNAVNGVTRIAQRLLNFKSESLRKYAESQWKLLVDNNYDSRPDMILAAQTAVAAYAESMLLSDTEIILALDGDAELAMSTAPVDISGAEKALLLPLLEEENPLLLEAAMGGKLRVFRHFYFTPFRWRVLLTEERGVFYADAEKIKTQALITLAFSLAAAALVLIVITRRLTKPLGRVIAAMSGIIAGGNLNERVRVEYRDETGHLALTFNTMLRELEKAYGRIKGQAFEAVLAQKKEERIRKIFQKYVPKDLIDKFFASPESMLVGDNRQLAILFSDIRSFTTISEGLSPDELVKNLNRYFSGQVDIIMNRGGIVDKYIGDAIMAVWGAPVQHDDDALQSVLSGLDMIEAVKEFNKKQGALGKPEFHIGIGINYGIVTVGNIGSERKMDYTVIGDMVNLASRMEGLTKTYHQEILISESLFDKLKDQGAIGALPLAGTAAGGLMGAAASCQTILARLLDTVAVKGKTRGVKIYTVRRRLDEAEARGWAAHNEGMELYYNRAFTGAAEKFERALALLPGDHNAQSLLERSRDYAVNPPPENWDGVEVMKTK
ncbi:MAG: adenylate/guanylate cyclase domain-containing protein [Spirochaetaceae bacterium]|jgi:class 3 adenylate cyclase/HAMP domain-containing protein|nr:adenylate/guanylate cyclase domain-containing protein [Spirochaetaceae bacterium]